MSSTARSATVRPTGARPSERSHVAARAAARRRPMLVEVPAPAAAVAGRGVFSLVVVALLLSGMGGLLILNTTLAQGAFEINALTRAHNALAVQEQTLLQQVANEESPESLQKRADQLGMVPVSAPVFLRLADGAVLGTPVPAERIARKKPVTTLPTTGGSPSSSAGGGDAAVATTMTQIDGAVSDAATSTRSGTHQ